jgi:thioester reductase-like protein
LSPEIIPRVTEPSATVLLTGVTGFLGKVVLEELLRRREELGIERVWVQIRPRHPATPSERFRRRVVPSPAFANLPSEWSSLVDVVGGDLAQPGAGLSDAERRALERSVTHVIHCAASVEFDLPIAEALAANATSALEVLELARGCTHLRSLVSVSTAYVTPHRGGIQVCEEVLPPLPEPAAALYARIHAGQVDERAVLRATGHPNTYTLTKALAEHLLVERKGAVPLSIVRPSIITPSRERPQPGWIDNPAAFAAFVSMVGSGYHRVLCARSETALDLVPCDAVSERVVAAAFHPPTTDGAAVIRHAVAGLPNACPIDLCIDVVLRFFQARPVARLPLLRYVGPPGLGLEIRDILYQRLPTTLARLWFRCTGQRRKETTAARLAERTRQLHAVFPYFTCNTFDFRSSMPLEAASFDQRGYLALVAQGVMEHLLQVDRSEISIGGRRHQPAVSDLRWILRQPRGGWMHRLLGWLIAKALRRGAERVTFDEPSFERALAQVPPGDGLVIVPAHRSYVDFVLLPYLCFARPDLPMDIPNIAAAEEFSRIALLGRLLKAGGAFYIRRGLGKEDAELTRRIHELVRQHRVLLFFIEGQRSRARRFLPPRRGMLRSLQSSREVFTILPVALSYDRVPEEAAMMAELRGQRAAPMRLRVLLDWLTELGRGKIHLGRMHVAAGAPLRLLPSSDVHALSRAIVGELQSATAASTFHLRAFIFASGASAAGVDLEWLSARIGERGGRVLDSRLDAAAASDPRVERCYRYEWAHWFYDDVERQLCHPVVRHYLARNRYRAAAAASPSGSNDARLGWLVRALMEPVCRDYQCAAEHLAAADRRQPPPTTRDIVRLAADAHLPDLEGAFEHMAEEGILAVGADGLEWTWGPGVETLAEYRYRCAWERGGWAVQASSPAR